MSNNRQVPNHHLTDTTGTLHEKSTARGRRSDMLLITTLASLMPTASQSSSLMCVLPLLLWVRLSVLFAGAQIPGGRLLEAISMSRALSLGSEALLEITSLAVWSRRMQVFSEKIERRISFPSLIGMIGCIFIMIADWKSLVRARRRKET